MKNRTLIILFCLFVVGGTSLVHAQLPPEVQADRLAMRGQKLVEEENWGAALAAYDELFNLPVPPPVDAYYYYAVALTNVGRLDNALEELTLILGGVERGSEIYSKGLNLYSEIEFLQSLEAGDTSAAEVALARGDSIQGTSEAANRERYEWYRRALKAKSEVVQDKAFFGIAKVHYSRGHYKRYLSSMDEAAGSVPEARRELFELYNGYTFVGALRDNRFQRSEEHKRVFPNFSLGLDSKFDESGNLYFYYTNEQRDHIEKASKYYDRGSLYGDDWVSNAAPRIIHTINLEWGR